MAFLFGTVPALRSQQPSALPVLPRQRLPLLRRPRRLRWPRRNLRRGHHPQRPKQPCLRGRTRGLRAAASSVRLGRSEISVVTNAHVMAGQYSGDVDFARWLADPERRRGRRRRSDTTWCASPSCRPRRRLACSNRVNENLLVGDDVLVLGNAKGRGGHQSHQRASWWASGPNLVEVDAPFQPGNSGSPIIQKKDRASGRDRHVRHRPSRTMTWRTPRRPPSRPPDVWRSERAIRTRTVIPMPTAIPMLNGAIRTGIRTRTAIPNWQDPSMRAIPSSSAHEENPPLRAQTAWTSAPKTCSALITWSRISGRSGC